MADETKQFVQSELPEQAEKEVVINHIFPCGLKGVYANQMIVQNTLNEFTISFFQILQPPILKPEDIEKVETIDAECVARVIVSPDKMGEFVDAINRNWGRFLEKQKLVQQNHDDTTNTNGRAE